jgi:hypothetical protein
VGYLRNWTIGLMAWLLCGAALQAAGDGGVTGTVADQSGARLPGVGVQVVAAAGARALASTTTNAEGAFRIERLPEGEYWVEFVLAGNVPAAPPSHASIRSAHCRRRGRRPASAAWRASP